MLSWQLFFVDSLGIPEGVESIHRLQLRGGACCREQAAGLHAVVPPARQALETQTLQALQACFLSHSIAWPDSHSEPRSSLSTLQ